MMIINGNTERPLTTEEKLEYREVLTEMSEPTGRNLFDSYNVFHHTLHRLLWQWLADNPSKSKADWVGWKSNGGDVEDINMCHCFACDYASDTSLGCAGCPLIWQENLEGFRECDGKGGMFVLWYCSTNPTERTELALKIKDLPVKDGVVCD